MSDALSRPEARRQSPAPHPAGAVSSDDAAGHTRMLADPRRPIRPWLYRVLYVPSFWLTLLVFGYQCFGRRRLMGRQPLIVVANHQSHLDPIPVGLATTAPLNYMARAALFRIPLFRRVIRLLGAFPVRRGQRDRSPLEYSAALLGYGHRVLIFGEGTRSWTHEILPVRGGVEVIARLSRAPIVPLLLDGAGRTNPRGSDPLRMVPHRIAVSVGEPISPQVYDQWPERTLPDRLREVLRRDLSRLRAYADGPRRADGQVALSRVPVALLLAYLRLWRFGIRGVRRAIGALRTTRQRSA